MQIGKAFVVAAVGAIWVLAAGASVGRERTSQLPVEEVRAVAFLVREVPRWKAENDCYSCHNNGDAARALIVASTRGHAVGTALADTLDWLRQPEKWNHNKTTGGIDDKPLARIQFAGALRLAVDAGLAPASALRDAAAVVVQDQKADGSWQLDSSQSIGSPTTYGTTLATWAATRVLMTSPLPAHQSATARAHAWLRAVAVERVIDAAAVVLALGGDADAGAAAHRQRALSTLKRGQAPDGGWGPYVTVSAEAFDTALVVLALSQLREHAASAAPTFTPEDLTRAIARGREYLTQAQMTDGSWPETTRPMGQESYAQRISTTGWALLALIASR
jgi:hypothetical protein